MLNSKAACWQRTPLIITVEWTCQLPAQILTQHSVWWSVVTTETVSCSSNRECSIALGFPDISQGRDLSWSSTAVKLWTGGLSAIALSQSGRQTSRAQPRANEVSPDRVSPTDWIETVNLSHQIGFRCGQALSGVRMLDTGTSHSSACRVETLRTLVTDTESDTRVRGKS